MKLKTVIPRNKTPNPENEGMEQEIQWVGKWSRFKEGDKRRSTATRR